MNHEFTTIPHNSPITGAPFSLKLSFVRLRPSPRPVKENFDARDLTIVLRIMRLHVDTIELSRRPSSVLG